MATAQIDHLTHPGANALAVRSRTTSGIPGRSGKGEKLPRTAGEAVERRTKAET